MRDTSSCMTGMNSEPRGRALEQRVCYGTNKRHKVGRPGASAGEGTGEGMPMPPGLAGTHTRLATAAMPLAREAEPEVVMRKWQGSAWRTSDAVSPLMSPR